jgi:Reverse transcriptase (RNA-dependent DNA polymerase)
MAYLPSADLLPTLQSGFRSGHSTETAVLQVVSELLRAVDRGDLGALILLHLTAAFDTVDHDILLQHLQQTFGIDGAGHWWFRSYLIGWTQYSCRGTFRSFITRLLCGAPQGSVLGPLLCILYVVDLTELIERHGMSPHLCADDTQVGGSCRSSNVGTFSSSISDCWQDVSSWVKSNRILLNSSKTENLRCTTSRRQRLLPAYALSVDGVMVDPVTSVRDRGIYFDADLSMRTRIQRSISQCFAALRQLQQIRQLVPPNTFQTLVVVLVL